jgi:hypothetical protein
MQIKPDWFQAATRMQAYAEKAAEGGGSFSTTYFAILANIAKAYLAGDSANKARMLREFGQEIEKHLGHEAALTWSEQSPTVRMVFDRDYVNDCKRLHEEGLSGVLRLGMLVLETLDSKTLTRMPVKSLALDSPATLVITDAQDDRIMLDLRDLRIEFSGEAHHKPLQSLLSDRIEQHARLSVALMRLVNAPDSGQVADDLRRAVEIVRKQEVR